MGRLSLSEELGLDENGRRLIPNPLVIPKSEAVARAGITEKQFSALVKEQIFPQPTSRGRWNRKRFNEAMDILKLPTDKVEPGWVYFLEMGDYIKIGWSTWPHDRRSHLQTSNPYDLILLGAFPGSIENEGALHRMFAHALKRNEWFHKTPGLLAYISWLKVAFKGHGAVIRGDLDNVTSLASARGKSVE